MKKASSSVIVPTETKAQFQERQRAGKLRGRASVDRGAVWCYVYSTALGFYWPPAGAVTGALCLFAKQGPAVARYSCYRTAPVNLGYGLVAAYGAKSAYRMGRCYKGEWGYSHMKLRWSQFKK